MGGVILISIVIILLVGIFIMTVSLINHRAAEKVKRSVDDVSTLLKHSQYSLIIFEPRNEDEFTCFGIVTDDDLRGAGIKKDCDQYLMVTLGTNSILADGIAPRKFLTLLRQVKRGAVSLDQIYKMTMAENGKYLRKLKASKTI